MSVSLGVFAGVFLSLWIVAGGLRDLEEKTRNTKGRIFAIRKLRPSYWGMQLGHLGFAVAIAGVALVSLESEERDIRMQPGDSAELAGYGFLFESLSPVLGPNYNAQQATFRVTQGEKLIATLEPQKRLYFSQNSPMTEAGIDPGLFRDIYIALGEPLEGQAWAVRIQYKPFVRWIWLGALLMACGGICAVSDKRYRLTENASSADRKCRDNNFLVYGTIRFHE